MISMNQEMIGIEYYEMPAHISNYTKSRKQSIKYIVVHYTANDGDTARNNGKYFSQPNRNASAHYFVDECEIIQSVKDIDIAWHCGAKSYKHELCRNDNSIGIEIKGNTISIKQHKIEQLI